MFQTFEQAKQYVGEQGIQVVDLKFCDLWGRWHHLTIPASQFELKIDGGRHRLRRFFGGTEIRQVGRYGARAGSRPPRSWIHFGKHPH